MSFLGGIGKAFGLNKLFDSIGMPWLGNVLSLATNFMTGNWVAAARDVFNLVSQFSNNSWRNRVDTFPPLGPFGSSPTIGGGCFSESRAAELSGRVRENDPLGFRSASRAIFLAHETAYNNSLANENLRNANARYAV